MSERLSVGDKAPDFRLTDDKGDEVTLSSLRGKKAIVYFYPAAMTAGCTKQACDFTESLDSLRAHGFEVLGISNPCARSESRDSVKSQACFVQPAVIAAG